MEQTNTSLFSLSIDPVTKAHLTEAAKWARFLAITGMVFLVLMIIAGVFGSAMLFSTTSRLESEYGGSATGMGAYGTGIFAAYMIIVAVIYFFPLLFTLRFANN